MELEKEGKKKKSVYVAGDGMWERYKANNSVVKVLVIGAEFVSFNCLYDSLNAMFACVMAFL